MKIPLTVVLLTIMFGSILLIGSVFQTYEQTVKTNGDSIIKKEYEIGLFSGMLGENASAKIAQACSADHSLGCTVDNEKITDIKQFSNDEKYYSLKTDYGIPYVEYEIEIRKIPVDKFAEMLDKTLFSAGLINKTSDSYGEPLNLQDTEANKEIVPIIREMGMDIKYVVVVPGEIISATAGNSVGSINANSAEFMLSDVLAESQPIVVKSREINWAYMIIIVAVLAIALFALSFRKKRKKQG